MTEQVDLDALIAEARCLIAHTRTYNFGMWSADKLAHEVAGELADALESARAELRQERERADDLYAANVGLVDAAYATDAALSRAEETIDRVKRVIATSGTLWGDELRVNYGALSDAITEYDKQKEQG